MSDAALRRAVRHDGWIGDSDDLDTVLAVIGRLAAIRAAEGGTNDDFEVIVAASTSEPTLDLYRRFEDEGVTGMLALPWWPGSPEFTTIEAKRGALERFAGAFLA